MGVERLKDIDITDADIQWVEEVMNGKLQFDDARKQVIKNMESIDIQAFPGSGKTTILVAKLAILAKKWSFPNSGICVLSHTNVAREEIEDRLGNSDVGRKLLSYPHFIGTVHSFCDTYITLPWLRSKGYQINMIDTQYVREIRWKALSYKTCSYLEMQHRDNEICEYKGEIGKINWDKGGSTKQKILDVIEKTQRAGYFTFGEMLLFAKKILNEYSDLSESIQQRFPILFIDEAQDTDLSQWELINKAFGKANIKSIRQGYGDSNQAIYSNINVDDEVTNFPRENALVLSESRRFGSDIAKLANTVAVSKEQMTGTTNKFNKKNIEHTIFLFEKNRAADVIKRYGQLVINTFSDEELNACVNEGCHVVGMVHVKKDETTEKKFPKGIYDYWNSYDAHKSSKTVMPKYLIEYFRRGIEDFRNNGEKIQQIEWIAKGIRHLINILNKSNYIPATGNIFAGMQKALTQDQSRKFRELMKELSDIDVFINEKDWESLIQNLKNLLALFNLKSYDNVKQFWKWIPEENLPYEEVESQQRKMVNHYIYKDEVSGRSVDLEFGSIHSVKGRTHLSTLVLETFLRTHNMKKILKYLCATPPKSIGKEQKRLRCQYVAMTRARALLCLAIPINFVDDKAQESLKSLGWKIEKV
ncbi:UvrD-helicase domain-containing protein [[Clostridium] hylemonae]|uniref:UvrD-helicase domain-containing protein n=1 Tax=[Clostridium] hylemonae TaxID=89153 RepID=UPI001D05C60E|nr:UvrD-helicase domain-containing protein [[Clostridium] hylemonae]